jgi:hypothetical protein
VIRPPKASLYAFYLWISAVAVFSASAQQPPLPQLTVQVTDQYGAVMTGALVAITNSAGVLKAAAYAGADGSAVFPIAPGHYKISAREDGFLNGQTEVDFPKADTATLALPISTLPLCGPCFTPEPMLPDPTQPVITALIEPDKRGWFPFHRGKHD